MRKIFITIQVFVILVIVSVPVIGDQIIQYNEQMVGANHPTLSDTLNRGILVQHNAEGVHTTVPYTALSDVPTTFPWDNLTDTPTTLAGYGITDGAGGSTTTLPWDNITSKPTNLITGATSNQGLIATDNTLGLDNTCSTNEIMKWNGSVWACASDAESAGTNPSFDNVQSGTNTSAAMVVGTGGSLAVSGSGTIAATTAAALASDPTDCGVGEFATSIAADGTLTCDTPAGTGDMLASVYDTNADNVVDSAAALSAQYIDWNSGSGGDSIANKPTLGDLAALDNGAAIDITGNAGTATALAANPTDCSEGDFATGIAASGNLTCGTPTGSGDMLAATYDANADNVVDSAIATAVQDNLIVNADVNDSAAIDTTKIADGSVTSTEFQYIGELTSDAQGQLDTKAPLISPSFTTPDLGVATATSINTGQGANSLYAMDQSVRTTDNVVFASITTDEWITSCIASDNACGIGLGNQSDPTGQYLDAAYLWFNVTDDMVKVRNGDNTVTLEVMTSGASHSGTFATTGPLSGALPVFTVTDNTTLARGTHTMNAMVYIDNVARTISLPEVVASGPSADQVVPGAVYCVMVWGAHITRVDPHANDGVRLDGAEARDSNGDAIASTAVAGSKVCLIADSASGWSAEPAKGTWAAE